MCSENGVEELSLFTQKEKLRVSTQSIADNLSERYVKYFVRHLNVLSAGHNEIVGNVFGPLCELLRVKASLATSTWLIEGNAKPQVT